MPNNEIVEFLRTIRLLKAKIEILTGIKLKKSEKKVVEQAVEELSNSVLIYLRGFTS
jgi:hypothetical protein